jgi:hypothetical protein
MQPTFPASADSSMLLIQQASLAAAATCVSPLLQLLAQQLPLAVLQSLRALAAALPGPQRLIAAPTVACLQVAHREQQQGQDMQLLDV